MTPERPTAAGHPHGSVASLPVPFPSGLPRRTPPRLSPVRPSAARNDSRTLGPPRRSFGNPPRRLGPFSQDFRDQDRPRSKAKPDGVVGCEIWVKIGGNPPADPSELHYLGSDTNAPYLAEYPGADAGKPAHYWLRWVNTRGEKGPWSDNVGGTIPG